MNVFASVLLVFAPALASGSGDDHGHGNGLWEWAGAFALSSEHTYTLTFRPREPAIQFLYVPASTADAAGIERYGPGKPLAFVGAILSSYLSARKQALKLAPKEKG